MRWDHEISLFYRPSNLFSGAREPLLRKQPHYRAFGRNAVERCSPRVHEAGKNLADGDEFHAAFGVDRTVAKLRDEADGIGGVGRREPRQPCLARKEQAEPDGSGSACPPAAWGRHRLSPCRSAKLPEAEARQEARQAKQDEEGGGEHFGSRPVSCCFHDVHVFGPCQLQCPGSEGRCDGPIKPGPAYSASAGL